MPAPLMALGQAAPWVTNQGGLRRSNSLPSNITNGEEGFTRSVDPNELVSTHVEQLGASGNRGLRQSRMRGMQAGASRGGINSNLAQATGENAWLDAATRMGEQQAGAYQAAAGQNLDSLARQRLGTEQNATSIFNQVHGDSTQAGIAHERNEFDRETDVRRRGWDVEDQGLQDRRRQQDRGWEVEDRDFGERTTQRRNREGLAAETIRNILASPEYLRDPAGAAGLIQFYQDQWNQQFPYDGGSP